MASSVPRLWPGSTVVCIGSGPSLTQADVDACREKARVIVVNDAYKLALWADLLYACDSKWWKWAHTDKKRHPHFADFHGLKFALEPQQMRWPQVQTLRNMGPYGLELNPVGVRTGSNSGYQAINLAVHFGAKRILLLGYDMKLSGSRAHFFGPTGAHPDNSKPPFQACLKAFQTLVAPLAKAGVDVINCTPGSALKAFPMASLRDVLIERAA